MVPALTAKRNCIFKLLLYRQDSIYSWTCFKSLAEAEIDTGGWEKAATPIIIISFKHDKYVKVWRIGPSTVLFLWSVWSTWCDQARFVTSFLLDPLQAYQQPLPEGEGAHQEDSRYADGFQTNGEDLSVPASSWSLWSHNHWHISNCGPLGRRVFSCNYLIIYIHIHFKIFLTLLFCSGFRKGHVSSAENSYGSGECGCH